MSALDAEALLQVTIQDYFGSVDKKNLEGVLSCLHSDAQIIVQTDNLIHSGRDTGIRRMLRDYFEAFPYMWHGDFSPIVDVSRQAVMLQFRWILRDHESKEEQGENINIFKLSNGKIHKITIYMSSKENPLR